MDDSTEGPSWVGRLMGHCSWLGAALAGAAGLLQLGLLLFVFFKRAAYPLDLEWEEGGMLCHALRILQGKSIYGPPSVDFISFLYTPFYPFLLAVLGKVFGLSYLLGRCVSILSFLTATTLMVVAIVRNAKRGWIGAAWGIAAAGLIAATFPRVGAWYDLVRNDSLFLALTTGSLFLIFFSHRSHARIIVAGILMGLAFLTKQTGSLFVLYSGAALLLLNWRKLPTYVVTVGLVAGGTVLVLNHSTGGWFWRIIFEMHQGHDFYFDRLWPETELLLVKASPVVAGILGLWLLVKLVEWLARRKWTPHDRGNLYWFTVAIAGVVVAAIGFSTQWAETNTLIPGLFFGSGFAAMACCDLTDGSQGGWRRSFGGPVSLLLGGALAVQLVLQLYSPTKHLLSAEEWQTGREFLATLRRQERPLLIPYHPWYLHLIGRETKYHQMSTNDIVRAGLSLPTDLVDRVTKRYYRTIILDNSPIDNHNAFMLDHYKVGHLFTAMEAPRVVTGFEIRPKFVLVPITAEPVPKGGRRVFGFEDGTYNGWVRTGSAFGDRPIGGPGSDKIMAGPYEGAWLAGSYHGGDKLTGRLRSPEFVVDRPYITYRIGGGQDSERLAVRLLVGNQEIHRGTGRNSHFLEERRVDVRQYLGQKMRVELVDDSDGAWGHLLFDDLQLRQD
jgi:hypothetical protein